MIQAGRGFCHWREGVGAAIPLAPLTMRSTCCGGGDGTVFELTPNSDGTYTESTLYSFTGASTGFSPNTDLVIDKAGNLYGTTVNGGLDHGDGVVFKVTPQPGGGVKESIIHRFFCNSTACRDG